MRSLLLTLALFVAATASAAAAEPFTADGWYTWRVSSVDNMPQWCCVQWNAGRAMAAACTLDGEGVGYIDRPGRLPDSDEMQIYARVQDGKVIRVRALSPACPVQSDTPPIDLGRVEAASSVSWLEPLAQQGQSDALAAVAAHRGEQALSLITDLALESGDAERRGDAVFWLGQLRVAEAKPTITRLMFDDPDPRMRTRAAFALAESSAPDRATLLIRQGHEDRDPEVRGEAWFWLAQTGMPEAEAAIRKALRTDPSGKVRDQAVFALSQLPDERGVDVLLGLLRDRDLPMPVREQALFWLAQSDSDEAFQVIDGLLAAPN